ncbi:unnamed protein product [Ixodes pacificus]
MLVAYVPLILILSGVTVHAETTDVGDKSTDVPSQHDLNGTSTVSVTSIANAYTDSTHENSSASTKASGTTSEILGSSTVSSEAASQRARHKPTVSANTSQEPRVASPITVLVNISQEPEVTSPITLLANTSREPEVTSPITVSGNTSREAKVTSPITVSSNASPEPRVTSPKTVPGSTSPEPQVASNATLTQNPHSTAMDVLNNTRTTAESRTTAKVSNVANITDPDDETSAQANVTTSFRSTEFVTKEGGPLATNTPTTRDMSTSTSEKQGRRRHSKSAIIATVISVVVLLIGLVGMGLWFYNVRYRLHRRDRPILRDTEGDDADNPPFSVVYYQNDGNEDVMLQKH